LFNEAFRTLRAAVTLSGGTSTAKRLLVTSARPGDGKTMVSVNLALAFAHLNQQVLLIDGDLRRATVHSVLSLAPAPGFVDLLKGYSRIDEVIRDTGIPNLSVMPCGTKLDECVELLASPGLGELLDVLGQAYDWVIVDTPPTGPIADACLIGRFVRHAVVVVLADNTPADEARLAMQRLQEAEVEVVGAVLNRADLARSGYYYGPYYSKEYTQYYTASEASSV
jgi:tyrosine-protein kinase Etk/Wzc